MNAEAEERVERHCVPIGINSIGTVSNIIWGDDVICADCMAPLPCSGYKSPPFQRPPRTPEHINYDTCRDVCIGVLKLTITKTITNCVAQPVPSSALLNLGSIR
ncbi:hypothetical protein NDU88_009930 [Pleurodeles waltl]|uniref:Uncharacterized protein n=1 Tax=Pleurodeles waltl TaxID=8319 RepID=A0AAV7RZ21_PLEWA|nr:hypothetical protein NDU88_009930 [Pleurodeles waltl]